MGIPKTSGIYKIVNIVNSKIYVGRAVNLYSRWTEHKHCLRYDKHENQYLQRAWNKYGEDNFEFEVIELCKENVLCQREHYWATLLNSHNRKYGYNIAETGEIGTVRMKTESIQKRQQKRKENAKKRGYWFSDETKKRMIESNKGRKMSEENIQKLIKRNIGRKASEETRKKQSLAKLNKPHTLEHAILCSKTLIFGFRNDEHREKLRRSKFNPVLQFTLDNIFIREFESIKQAEVALGLTTRSNISACCAGRQKTDRGFIWKYKNGKNKRKNENRYENS